MPDVLFMAFSKRVMSLCNLLGCTWIAECFDWFVSEIMSLKINWWWDLWVPDPAVNSSNVERVGCPKECFYCDGFSSLIVLAFSCESLFSFQLLFSFKCTS